jgi:hypothetical protein
MRLIIFVVVIFCFTGCEQSKVTGALYTLSCGNGIEVELTYSDDESDLFDLSSDETTIQLLVIKEKIIDNFSSFSKHYDELDLSAVLTNKSNVEFGQFEGFIADYNLEIRLNDNTNISSLMKRLVVWDGNATWFVSFPVNDSTFSLETIKQILLSSEQINSGKTM